MWSSSSSSCCFTAVGIQRTGALQTVVSRMKSENVIRDAPYALQRDDVEAYHHLLFPFGGCYIS